MMVVAMLFAAVRSKINSADHLLVAMDETEASSTVRDSSLADDSVPQAPRIKSMPAPLGLRTWRAFVYHAQLVMAYALLVLALHGEALMMSCIWLGMLIGFFMGQSVLVVDKENSGSGDIDPSNKVSGTLHLR
ncbi:hypothetical protein F4777DRAFT_542354 [Nemania sp. FL0916]|nr:hypothetical protein F4777DRAFT_542354 [Nemania sp. FL0916]